MLSNQYGRFDASGCVFTITDPATPMPWINVVGNGRYGFVVSQNGGGFSWMDSSQFGVLTRWEMDLARDASGRWLYVSDLDTGEVWSLSPMPCRTPFARYACEHTLGSTTFRTEHSGVRAVWNLAVAPADPVEVWSVRLENTSGRPRRLRIASFFEWCCGVAPDSKREFHRLFFTVRHDAGRRAVFATKNMWDVPNKDERDHWNVPWPYVAAHAVCGHPLERPLAAGDKSAFLGRYGDPAKPLAMMSTPGDPPADGRFGRFGDAAAALGGDLALPAGGSADLHFLTVCESTQEAAEALIDRYRDPAVARAVAGVAASGWADRLGHTTVATGEPDFDLLNAYWLPYQAIAGRLWGRTGYYQQSGAFGFRDQLQDSQVWLPLDPARCRAQLLLHAAHQFRDGSVFHWWHPGVEFGLRTQCSDDYLWLPFVTVNYLKETGDWAVLDERTPFVERDGIAPLRAEVARGDATLLEHCLLAFERSFRRLSPRGLPHIGSCDWNDGLSAMGVGEKGESVWLGWFLVGILGDFAVVLDRRGMVAKAAEFRERRQGLIGSINEHAWDEGGKEEGSQLNAHRANAEGYFKGATRDDGRWVGASDQPEGKIFLNCQTWAVLTGGASPERLTSAWTAAKRHLVKDMGPLLLHPAYSEPDPGIGYITRYAPGLRENGGVYMHAATWALAAACAMKDVEAAERIWASISPPRRASDELGIGAEAYRAEPYVTPGNVDGPDSAYPGRAGWTWYTGSAAWLNRVSLEWVLGVRPVWTPTGEGLRIDPCPWPGLGKVEATRTWRGRTVRIRFDAATFSAETPPRLTVNGREHEGDVLVAADAAGARGAGAGGGGGAGAGAGGEIDIQVRWGIESRVGTLPLVGSGRTSV